VIAKQRVVTCHAVQGADDYRWKDFKTSSSAMAERPRELGDFNGAKFYVEG